MESRSFHELIAADIAPEVAFLDGMQLRNYEIVYQRSKGKTLEEIAEKYGLTREAIRQIVVRNYGDNMKEIIKATKAISESKKFALFQTMNEYIFEHKGITMLEIAEIFGHLVDIKLADFSPEVRRYIYPTEPRTAFAVVWSDEQIMSAIQKASIYNFPLAKDTYEKLLKAGEVVGPSAALIMKRFGYWSKACQMAGVESHTVSAHYTKKWSIEEQIDFLCQFLNHEHLGSSIAFYNKWQTQINPHAPSSQLLRLTFDGWQPAIQAALGRFRKTWNASELE